MSSISFHGILRIKICFLSYILFDGEWKYPPTLRIEGFNTERYLIIIKVKNP